MSDLLTKSKTLDSTEVAEMMNIEHYKILRKLDGDKDRKGYIQILTEAQMGVSDYFIPSTYLDASGKENKCYLFTKMGCEFIANKFTGEKGILFTAKYVKRFNEMEKSIMPIAKPEGMKVISLLHAEVGELIAVTSQIENRVDKLENTMTIDYSQQEEIRSKATIRVVEILGGKDVPAYKELNKKAFSQIWKDYKRVFDVNSYRNTPVKDFAKGLNFVTTWKPSRELELMIMGSNSQMRM